MAGSDEVTTRFRVDISELKANITTANKEIKSANAQFRAAASGMDDWESSTEGLQAKIRQMTSVLASERSKQESYEKQLEAVSDAERSSGQRADELRDAYKAACEQFGENSDEAKGLKTELAAVEKEQARNKAQADKLSVTVANQTAKVNAASSELKRYEAKLSDASSESAKLSHAIARQESDLLAAKKAYADAVMSQGKNSEAAKKLASQIRSLSGELRENKQKLDDASKAADDLDASMGAAELGLDSCTSKVSAAKIAFAALVADGIRRATSTMIDFGKQCIGAAADFERSASNLQANLGTTKDEAQRFAAIGREIYNDGWGASLDEVIASLKQAKHTLRDVSEEDLSTVTKGAQVLADTMGADVNESIRGINALIKGFGLSAEAATDLYTSGMQRGLNYTDELGDNLSEYSVRWGEAGMSASQYFSLLQAGTDNGAYNLDKVGDYLNEFLTSLSDGRMDEAMASMSQGTRDVFEQYKTGGAKAQDVLNAVIGELGGMASETDRAALASSLWSSLGEDNAMGMILSLGGVQDSYGDVAGAADAAATAASDNFGAKAQSAMRTLTSQISDKLYPVLSNVTGKFDEWVNSDTGKQFASDISESVGDLVTNLGEFSGWVVANKDGIAAFFLSVGTGIAVFKGTQAIGAFVGFLTSLHAAAKAAASGQLALNAAQLASPIGFVLGLIAALVAAIVYLWNTNEEFRNFWIGVWDSISSFVGEKVSEIGAFFTQDLPSFIDAAGAFISQLPQMFQQWLSQTAANVGAWVVGLVIQAQSAGAQFLSSVGSFVSQLPARFALWLASVLAGAVSWALSMAGSARNAGSQFLSGIAGFVSQLPGNFANFLASALSQVAAWAANLGNSGAQAAARLVSSVVSGLAGLPGRMQSIGGDIVAGVWRGIQGAVGWFTSQVSGFFGGIVDNAKRALGINSPSKVMAKQVGRWIPAGTASGIVGNLGVLKRGVQKMYQVVTDAPVKGIGGKSVSVADSPQSFVFHQYNQSPKALSRYEIYRQTRNQLRAAMG